MFKAILVGIFAVGILILGTSRVTAQQVAISTPFNRVNDSFFERIGIGFGFDINGGRNVVGLDPLGNPTANGRIQFRQNSVGAVAPAFGGFDANAAARTGFRIQGSGFSADLLGVFAQGSHRSIISDTPKIVIPNGGRGIISDTSQRPFVTGIIPIVGSNGGIIYNVPRPYWPTGPAVSYTYPLHDTIRRYYANQEQLQKEGEAEYARDFALKRAAARKAAESGADAARREMEQGGDAGESFRELALGFHPLLAVPEENPWIPYYGYGAGVVRLSLGDNSELGGNVTGGSVRWNFFVDTTLPVGGAVWVRDGTLVR
ncbi:MAG: hypothetical protein IH991_20395 [Planctomycetes bacterium]|nr:hypothetical protein [Planctomycetota bacterium]